MSKKQPKIPTIIIPQGYDLEEFLDVDDGDFNESPILSEEVKITFERNGNREKQSV